MIIAFTTSGEDLQAPLDSRFGRAPRFLLFDTGSREFKLIDNSQNLDAAQGAGIQSATNVSRAGAGALVTGHCGPKAFKVLRAAGIRIYNSDAPTVAEALSRYEAGLLSEASDADVEGHWV
jgi:predicted Fe-Mo cluster-binding NifX family protein